MPRWEEGYLQRALRELQSDGLESLKTKCRMMVRDGALLLGGVDDSRTLEVDSWRAQMEAE